MGNFLESVRAFIADNPLLQTGLDMGSIIVPFALLYAYFGLTFIAICGEIIALRRKRSAYNKCARQLACLSMLLGWLMLAGGPVVAHPGAGRFRLLQHHRPAQ